MRLVRLKELAERTSLSVPTLRRFIKKGMPHYRIGRSILVDPDEFDSWMKENFRRVESPQATDLELVVSNVLAKFR